MDHNIINMLLSAHQEYTSKTDAIDEFQVTKYNSESPQSLNPCMVKLCWTQNTVYWARKKPLSGSNYPRDGINLGWNEV